MIYFISNILYTLYNKIFNKSVLLICYYHRLAESLVRQMEWEDVSQLFIKRLHSHTAWYRLLEGKVQSFSNFLAIIKYCFSFGFLMIYVLTRSCSFFMNFRGCLILLICYISMNFRNLVSYLREMYFRDASVPKFLHILSYHTQVTHVRSQTILRYLILRSVISLDLWK